MDEAEKLSRNLIIMAHGKTIIRGNPPQIIKKYVKNFALEIREVQSKLQEPDFPEIFAEKRINSHIYFAETSEQLTPLMKKFEGKPDDFKTTRLGGCFSESR